MFLTDEEIKKRNILPATYKAVLFAGGGKKVSIAFGYKQAETVYRWYRNGGTRIPSQYIVQLCDMGGNRIKPKQILEECKKIKGR